MTMTSPRDDISRFTPQLRRYARALIAMEGEDGGAETADRLVQEAIVRALRLDWKIRTTNVRIWLYSTLTRLNRQCQNAESSDRSQAAGAGQDAASALSSAACRRGAVLQALERLSPGDREALLLVAVERFGYDEACEILRIAKPSLIARLARARLTLEESLSRPEPMRQSVGRARPYLRLVK